eukprot:gene2970-12978_t
MIKVAFCLLALCATAASAAGSSSSRNLLQGIDMTAYPEFPWCACDTNPLHSPIRTIYTGPAVVDGKNYLSFAVVLIDIPPTTSICVNMDLYKIEWEALATGHGCVRHSVVNGVYRTPGYDIVDLNSNKGLIRLSQLSFTQAQITAAGPGGIPVWLQLQDGCSFSSIFGPAGFTAALFDSTKDCCPPSGGAPPSGQTPPAGEVFPFCGCDTSPFSSPWRVELASSTPLAGGGERIALRLFTNGSPVRKTFDKFEINLRTQDVSSTFNRAFANAFINGKYTNAIYWERSRPVVKFTNLGISATATVATLTFDVQGHTLNEICGNVGSCTYAAFEKGGTTGACPLDRLIL